METILKPEYNSDDAKFKITKEELVIIKDKLWNLRHCKQVDGVYIGIAMSAYDDNGSDLLDGKLTFAGDTYFAIVELLKD